MKKLQPSATRLWVILAREAPIAAVLRRGPSKQVQLIKWNLIDDSFEHGQWFKGRIYERRCDLSPDGTLLIYFAANYKEPLFSWTAISKLPWLTALALWPKGDGWNGGGYFAGPREIHLDHFAGKDAPHSDFKTGCRKFRVTTLATTRGEDSPMWYHMLQRGGWNQYAMGDWGKYGETTGYSWKALVPEVWRKPHRTLPLTLEMSIEGLKKDNGPWYVTTYRVIDKSETELAGLGLTDWADWDQKGDLLFARDGCLFRQAFSNSSPTIALNLADFTTHKFAAIEAPDSAKKL